MQLRRALLLVLISLIAVETVYNSDISNINGEDQGIILEKLAE